MFARLFGGGKGGVAEPVDEHWVASLPIVSPPGTLRLSNTLVHFAANTRSHAFSCALADLASCSLGPHAILTLFDCSWVKTNKRKPATPFSSTPPKARPHRALRARHVRAASPDAAEHFLAEVRGRLRTVGSKGGEGGEVEHRTVLALVNPFSGKRQAHGVWQKCAEAVGAVEGVELTVVNTERPGHAMEFVRDGQRWDMILICSGDGLVHEVVNGLLQRADGRAAAAHTALCHLPGGTSNGLACSVGTDCLGTAVMAIARGTTVPWDGTVFDINGGDHKYAFSSLSWAIVPDIDLGTEWMRPIGDARMTVGAVHRIVRGQVYSGRVMLCNHPSVADAALQDLAEGEGPIGQRLLRELVPSKIEQEAKANGEGWEVLPHTSFFLWIASKLSVLDPGFLLTPFARGWGGKLNVVFVAADHVNRVKAFQAMDKMGSGEHMSLPFVQSRFASALVLEHGSTTKHFTADGERVDVGVVRAVVLPNALRVVACPEVVEESNAPAPHPGE